MVQHVPAEVARRTHVALVVLPRRELLVERPDRFKAYDVFARSGDQVLAIDDVVRPLYADLFQVGTGKPTRVADFEMPGLINGVYSHAVLVPGQGGLDVYAIAPYGIMSGNGHELARLPIRNGKIEGPGDVLNAGGNSAYTIEEHVSRSTQKPERLVERVCDWFRARGVTDVRPFASVFEDVVFRLPVELRRATAA